MSAEKLTAVHCRGCGEPLENPRRTFHDECLKADKRRRVAERREKERKKWLGVFRCPRCRRKCACETSQGTQNQSAEAGR